MQKIIGEEAREQVLALTGGSDATGLGKTWPTLLNETLAIETKLDWVTGTYAQQPVWPLTPRFSMLNYQSPSGLDNLMVAANYAVTVYGVSFFELLYYISAQNNRFCFLSVFFCIPTC